MEINDREPRKGRPRKYRLQADSSADNAVIGWGLTAMKELDARLFDLVCDLPDQALEFVAPGTGISIGSLYAHVYWADLLWLKRITGMAVPAAIEAFVEQATAEALHEGRAFDFGGRDNLFAVAEQIQTEYIYPAVRLLGDPGRDLSSLKIPMNVGGVITHLVWGKTYHSGQIGLMRLQWGSDYIWTFEPL